MSPPNVRRVPAPAKRRRPIGITILAVFNMVVPLLVCLAGFFWYVFTNIGFGVSHGQPTPTVGLQVAYPFFYLAGAMFVNGIGLLFLFRWAWVLNVIISVFWLALSIIFSLAFLIFNLDMPKDSHTFDDSVFPVIFVATLLSLGIFVYLIAPSTRRAFWGPPKTSARNSLT